MTNSWIERNQKPVKDQIEFNGVISVDTKDEVVSAMEAGPIIPYHWGKMVRSPGKGGRTLESGRFYRSYFFGQQTSSGIPRTG